MVCLLGPCLKPLAPRHRIVWLLLLGAFLSTGRHAIAWSVATTTGNCRKRSFLCNKSIVVMEASLSSPLSSSSSTVNHQSSESSSSANPLPRLPLPDPICSNIPGTWAFDTMSRRVNEEILERTVQDCIEDLVENANFEPIRIRIEALRHELTHAATTLLTDLDPEAAQSDKEWREWHAILQPYIAAKDTWLTAPWMVTEFYVYRRLMQCFRYWTKESPGYLYDPFQKQKKAGLISSVGSSEPALTRIASLPLEEKSEEGLQLAVSLALWCVS